MASHTAKEQTIWLISSLTNWPISNQIPAISGMREKDRISCLSLFHFTLSPSLSQAVCLKIHCPKVKTGIFNLVILFAIHTIFYRGANMIENWVTELFVAPLRPTGPEMMENKNTKFCRCAVREASRQIESVKIKHCLTVEFRDHLNQILDFDQK